MSVFHVNNGENLSKIDIAEPKQRAKATKVSNMALCSLLSRKHNFFSLTYHRLYNRN
jgi:hypothetical protein